MSTLIFGHAQALYFLLAVIVVFGIGDLVLILTKLGFISS